MAAKSKLTGFSHLFRKHSAKLLLLGVIAGGVVMYPDVMSYGAPKAAGKTASTDAAVGAISALKAQIAQATDARQQGELRVKLADAYMEHGRPIEAASELQLWVRTTPQSPETERVIIKLIAAHRQSNSWDAAASLSRSFLRDYPKSSQREAVYKGLVEIARFGQGSLTSEASALVEYTRDFPDSPGTGERLLRLAKVQEQIGDVAGSVTTLQKYATKFGADAGADSAGWRAAYLMHDRLRKTGEALTAAQAHLKKFPRRPSLSRDWQWVGDIGRSIEKWPEAIAAYKAAVAADPQNRDALALLLDASVERGTLADVQAAAKDAEANFKGDNIALDARLAVLRKELAEGKGDASSFDRAKALLTENYRVGDVGNALSAAIEKQPAEKRAEMTGNLIALYREQIGQKKGWSRSEIAVRLANVYRAQGKVDEALAVLETELKDNPQNRRELSRDFLMAVLDAQQNEMRDKKRTKFEIDAPAKRLMEAIKPVAYLSELRTGVDEVVGHASQRLKQKDMANSLRQQIDALATTEVPTLVETVNRESKRDTQRAIDAMAILNKTHRDKPLIFEAVAESVWHTADRGRPDQRERLVPWLVAWSDARQGNIPLQVEIAEALRRMGKSDEAVKILDRVIAVKITPQNGSAIASAIGSQLNIHGYGATRNMAAVDKLASMVEEAGRSVPVGIRQERYRQLAEVYGREKGTFDKSLTYYRKAVDLGLSNAGYEAARNLMMVLPAKESVELGNKLLADPANDRFVPELALLTASRMASGLKDVPGAIALVQRGNEARLTAFRQEYDHWNTLRELMGLSLDLSDPKRVTSAERKAFLSSFKPVTAEQTDALLNVALQWSTSQQLHEVAREVIRRAAAAHDHARQLDVYSQVLSRTRSNDQWHWDRNMEIAREEIARGNDGVACTMLRSLLKESASYNAEARTVARNLLLTTYKKFGEDLLAVDEKSPIAPLLRGANYLRLGEDKTAWTSYQQNMELFAQKVDEVPAEYVLFVTNELATGSDTDRDAAEQLLRLWLARTEKQGGIDQAVRAAVSLKLADVFYFGRRFDVARAEYQGVIDKYPDLPQATEARFRVGESFMYQKNYVEAAKVFEVLKKSKDPDTAIRGTFMTGVLQYTQGQRDEARETFKSLLDLAPSEDLASKALYQLALIYGDDNRFREMLDMLEAIGRLGREGKRWHTPGQVLTVMIHDPDMAIVQGALTVPVLVSTTNGDKEIVTLSAGAAGKGIYLTELSTTLGAPRPGDGMLQLLGNDIISYDYPDDFKAKFKYVPPPQGNIRIASDAAFAAASIKIVDEAKESVVDKASKGTKIERAADEVKEFRSSGEVKPGNPMYVRVIDPDRAVTADVNKVEVVARASSGDTVRTFITENSPATGLFEGMIKTAERPPETVASDSMLGRPAGMAGDKDPATAWESQHDGAPGKWITADLKDVFGVKTVTFASPDAARNAPVEYTVETSVNGTMWEPLYSTTKGKIAHGLSLSYGPMRHTHHGWSKVKGQAGGGKAPETLEEYVKLVKANIADINAGSVQSFEIDESEFDGDADVHMFVGYFQTTAGKYTFQMRAGHGALVIDGKIIASKGSDFGKDGITVDLPAGWHRVASFMTLRHDPKNGHKKGSRGLFYQVAGGRGGEFTQVVPEAPRGGRDGMPAPAVYAVPEEPKLAASGNGKKFELAAPVQARFVRLNVEKYEGNFVSVSEFAVTGSDGKSPDVKTLLPTEANILALSDNDVLEVSPGDDITLSYVDQINTKTPGEARVLSGKLKATYHNATVTIVSYDVKSGAGGVTRTAKPVYRIDPGDRIVAQVSDFDEDVGPDVNHVAIKVRTESGAELALEAAETAGTSGIFTKEIDTCDVAKPEPGKLPVRPGEKVYVVYSDRLNTIPGSRVERVAEIEAAKPTDGSVAIIPTRVELPPPGTAGAAAKAVDKNDKNGAKKGGTTVGEGTVVFLPPEDGKPSRVVLAAPLTVEVFDPDAAKDSHSTVSVEVTTSAGAKLTLPLELSDGASPRGGGRAAGKSAVESGRFVGQALLVLGTPDPNGKYAEAIDIERARGLLGAWRYASDGESGAVKAPVIPISGADEIKVVYKDVRTPGGKEEERNGAGRMVTDATIANLTRGFQDPHIATLHIGDKLYLRVEDGDRDATAEADTVTAEIASTSGEKYTVKLKETVGHSGVFIAELPMVHSPKPTPGNETFEVNFGDELTITYKDEANTSSAGAADRVLALKIALGSDADMLAFTKQFGSEELAVETQFKLAECYFELFKSHNQLKAAAEAKQALEAGRAVLAQVRDNYRGSTYEARVLYLLGSFHQELKEYEKAIENFGNIVRAYQSSTFAPDAQYKLAQCYEDKNDMEKACEEYVRLAYTYPDNPLIAKCMVRLSEYFYKSANYTVAANICGQFLEQYPEHEWAPRIAFRQGQCFFRAAEAQAKAGSAAPSKGKGPVTDVAKLYLQGAKAFDLLVENYKDADLRPDAMFWAGQSYHKGGDPVLAYRRYRRCTWDFPDSDAARYARGQLTLPEIQGAAKQDEK